MNANERKEREWDGDGAGLHFEIIGRCQFSRACQAAAAFSDRAKVKVETGYADLAAQHFDALAEQSHRRRCPCCHRPIALKHFRIYWWSDRDPGPNQPISRSDLEEMIHPLVPTLQRGNALPDAPRPESCP